MIGKYIDGSYKDSKNIFIRSNDKCLGGLLEKKVLGIFKDFG